MSNLKVKVQSFGRFLSNMVMPNIGAFIAWGFITALFIPTGWLPNESLGKLVGPMITYLLPLLIGYSGGRLAGGERGAVVGAITTMGIIVGSEIPMFLGAMIVGPLGGWAIKTFDKAIEGKVKSGFEMLVNNFSAGIIGMLLALLSFSFIGGVVTSLSDLLAAGVRALVDANLLALTSVIVEPAKILFLNNAINHGIFSPLGIQESSELGKSIFFLIEANPGPGLGILIAYMLFGKGSAKNTASSASIIHFFGGIHEIYFPYVLMNPRLILAVIAGGATGVLTNTLLGGGLVSPASPGSIIAVLAMTPAGAHLAVIASVILSCVVTFVIASVLLKMQKEEASDDALESAQAEMAAMKAQSKGGAVAADAAVAGDFSNVRKIYVSCDAGMGSSAMGASMLRKKVQAAGLNVEVQNVAINDLPQDAQLVVTHKDLTARAQKQVPTAQHLSLNNFLDGVFYDGLVAKLTANSTDKVIPVEVVPQVATERGGLNVTEDQIFLNLTARTKEEAIQFAGEQLVKLGFAEADYVPAMFEREQQVSTYLGEGIAVPHGTIAAKDKVLKTGIVFCQYREGVRFTDEEDGVAKLVIGIAARNNEHIQVVSAITNALDDEKTMEILTLTDDPQKVLRLLKGE
ncbi:PTS mannitol transporter subunit IICBA [Actinobacillus equuli]|uniref:PTS system mannitol-specific EIICBA component n=2 Tax=Actinobacillus equuli TaxID=718 RepID=A0A0A7MH42_ACTEU|nr:PTS mannitol transporter subunit IICBA [Actinobacillus equuli]AIZ79990.1 PTS system mannitol-specific transporter subunit IICBA [Actinobacillus equuli subsp. equuli]MDE8035146.1 PTS mannitol transporter subunit IICBA [Actinobacillus equuli subsp. equuli]WGE41940.1 PTS mannitol transporter subunit IICBA [Actinobacillus equuli subsp. haemolyticus]WGE44101.1 PTS mannitol transporter subunit IICBA [Actinobacillus equuli subsp. equuli]WGE52657.1 PTS mannitol transporter subunit IICBA [Actinobaci